MADSRCLACGEDEDLHVAAVTLAVARGGDTATVATVAGCLARALTGEPALQVATVSRLEGAGRIGRTADALAVASWRQT